MRTSAWHKSFANKAPALPPELSIADLKLMKRENPEMASLPHEGSPGTLGRHSRDQGFQQATQRVPCSQHVSKVMPAHAGYRLVTELHLLCKMHSSSAHSTTGTAGPQCQPALVPTASCGQSHILQLPCCSCAHAHTSAQPFPGLSHLQTAPPVPLSLTRSVLSLSFSAPSHGDNGGNPQESINLGLTEIRLQ
jgi:hypothetical protein